MGFMSGALNSRSHRVINELRDMADIIEMMRQSDTSTYSAKQLNKSLEERWTRIDNARQDLKDLDTQTLQAHNIGTQGD